MEKPTKIAVVISNRLSVTLALQFAFSQPRDFLLIEDSRISDILRQDLVEEGFEFILSESDFSLYQIGFSPSSLFILTSGTTGKSKIVKHSLIELNTFSRVGDLGALTWFVPAPIGSFAWYQMIFLNREKPDQNLWLTTSTDLMHNFEKGIKNSLFDALSCTPTFIRYASLAIDSDTLLGNNIRRVTLGGEVVLASDLHLASEIFPRAIITHVYAAAEIGPIFTSNDLRPGYPLSRYQPEVHFKIDGDMFYVKSGMGEHKGQWYPTGDLAVIEDGRLLIVGRLATDFINVGGNRVSLRKVEECLLEIPEVRWVKAYGVESRLMGTLVGVQIVGLNPSNTKNLEEIVNSHSLGKLADYEIPCRVELIDSIPLKRSLKK